MARAKSTKRKGATRGTDGPSIAANSYGGSIVLPAMAKQIDSSVRILGDTGSITSTAGGVINTVFASDPTAMVQWANVIGNYDAYRVLGVEVVLIPFNKGNQTLAVAYALSQGAMIVASDLNSIVAITSQQSGVEFASAKFYHGSEVIRYSVKASNREHMEWVDTNVAPTFQYSIKTRGDGYFASSTHYQYYVRRLIQFRSTL